MISWCMLSTLFSRTGVRTPPLFDTFALRQRNVFKSHTKHCKRGRSTICGYVQTVANCLLLHIEVCKKRYVHRVWSSVQR